MASRKTEEKNAGASSASVNGKPKDSKETNSRDSNGSKVPPQQPPTKNPNGIPDYRLEQLPFHTEGEWKDGHYHYIVVGDTTAPPPPSGQSRHPGAPAGSPRKTPSTATSS